MRKGWTNIPTGTQGHNFGLSATPPFAVTPGSSRTFTLTFAPSSTGSQSASVSIASSDSDESPYTFTLTGTGVPPSPEINIKKGPVSVADGALGHDFGSLETGITSQPVVSPGSSTSFTVAFTPDAQGEHAGTVTLRSNDADEDPYTFTVQGTGLLPPNVKISVKDGPSTISSGATYDFGEVSTGSSSSVVLTIENGGISTLQIINILLTDGDIGVFSRDISATQFTVPPGETTAFSVTFTPQTDASCRRNLEINNNDSQNSTYIITFKGRGMD